MNERIIELRKSLNLSQTDFGKQIGISKSSVSDIEIGRISISERTIISICSKFNVNEEWLKYGNGNMFLEYDKKHDEFFSVFQNLKEPLQDFLIRTARDLLDTQSKL